MTSTTNDPGAIGGRPRRPPAFSGAAPNFAPARKMRCVVGSSPMFREPGHGLHRLARRDTLSGVSSWITVSVPSAFDANALPLAGS